MVFKSNGFKKLLLILCSFIFMSFFFIWQNNSIVLTEYKYVNRKLPQAFNNFKIVHISDLHNKDFHGKLTKKVSNINPDLIVITGDLIDRRNMKIDIALEFAKEMVKVAPTYYVSGNHEQLSKKYDSLKEELEKLNVQIMDNSYIVLNNNGDKIGLMGIADPAIQQREGSYLWEDSSVYIINSLKNLLENIDTEFNILLSHRPEHFRNYEDMKVDLVFSGHAHGGQVRIPFIGGLVAPNQGLFPEFTEGLYSDGLTSMIVSRGLGNSIIPLRIFNRPELVVVNLNK